ncbi:MAG: lmo0937 family membrane protein [Chthoniobacterales bacterium]
MPYMLLIIALILVVFWLFGFFMHIAGGLIHLVLLIAVIMFILHMVRGRRV